MAQLDPLLSALVQRNAQELVMSEGRPAALRLDGKLRPVSQKRLDRPQITRLLAELSDLIDEAATVTAPLHFRYELCPGQSFDCQVQEHEGKLTARVVAAPAPPARVAAPPPVTPPPQVAAPRPVAPSRQVAAPPPAPVALAVPDEEPESLFSPPEDEPLEAGPLEFAAPPEPDFEIDLSVEDEPLAQAQPAGATFAPSVVDPADIPIGDVARLDEAPGPPPAAKPAPATVPRRAGVVASSTTIERLLRHMVEMRASDLHLSSGEVPMLRLHGEMCRIEGAPPVGREAMVKLLEPIMPERNGREFDECNDTDFAHEIPGVARFRANIFTDRKGRGAVFRMIPSEILTAQQLALPEAVMRFCDLTKGLVLVTGPTGSGKSTTLAAMVDHINRTRSEHIITIEDPVEFVHPNHKCLVNQREVVTHTQSFKRALRAALREDPDIVLVGEMRDLETIAIAIETAETGHLVFGTLHTTTAISTVDRIIDQFPADRQAQIRTMLSESLKGVVAQTLMKKIGGGRVAALEVLVVTPAISNLIREGKTFQIPSLMQTGRKQGMRLLNDALIELVKSKTVDPDEAYRKAVDKAGFTSWLKSAGLAPATGEAG